MVMIISSVWSLPPSAMLKRPQMKKVQCHLECKILCCLCMHVSLCVAREGKSHKMQPIKGSPYDWESLEVLWKTWRQRNDLNKRTKREGGTHTWKGTEVQKYVGVEIVFSMRNRKKSSLTQSNQKSSKKAVTCYASCILMLWGLQGGILLDCDHNSLGHKGRLSDTAMRPWSTVTSPRACLPWLTMKIKVS